MPEEHKSFPAGIDFESVLRIISKQIYETPLAFIRENVQNAVDAVRIQASREGAEPGDERYRIDVTIDSKTMIVRDNGNGMSASDLQKLLLDDRREWKTHAGGLCGRVRRNLWNWRIC